jgi:hypothetical protein
LTREIKNQSLAVRPIQEIPIRKLRKNLRRLPPTSNANLQLMRVGNKTSDCVATQKLHGNTPRVFRPGHVYDAHRDWGGGFRSSYNEHRQRNEGD